VRLAGALPVLLLYLLVIAANGGSGDRDDADPARPVGASVYWGAWIDGETYGDPHGDAPWDGRTWNRFERHASKRVSIIHFGVPTPWARPFWRLPLTLARQRGAIPLVDMDTVDPARGSGRVATLRQIARGRWDRPWKRWAEAAARYGHPFFLRLDWEMNGLWFPWAREARAAPGVFVAAWRRLHRIAARQGAGNVTWVWCPNAVFDGSTPLSDLYPGDDVVDWTCMDGYNKGRHPLEPTGWESFGELFGETYGELLALAPGKPIMIGETGSTEVGDGGVDPSAKAAWITDAMTVQLPLNFPQVKAVTWFNWNIEEGDGQRWDWPIESSEAVRRAFAAAIASRYYAQGRFGHLRRHATIRPIR
jgi:Glycosyl hydrolase family 26